jgi:hypothetical protein
VRDDGQFPRCCMAEQVQIAMPPLLTHSTVDDCTRYLERCVGMSVREREYIYTMERDVHKVPGLPASC